MTFHDRTMTATDAANAYVAAAFPGQNRKIGFRLINPYRFKLEGGNQWYTVNMLDGYAGWSVDTEVNQPGTYFSR